MRLSKLSLDPRRRREEVLCDCDCDCAYMLAADPDDGAGWDLSAPVPADLGRLPIPERRAGGA
jgi:hypothetical protein